MAEQERPMGLYIHIPFCNKKCDYCDFVSFSMDKKAQQEYLAGLFAEIDSVKEKFEDKTFDTIFIGGGTPSIVFEGFISSLARKLYSSFKFAEKIEFTIEVNPSSFTKEKFFEYVESGINRISVGVQCLDSKLLAEHGRIQSVENINNTFTILKNSEFPNINSDVMIGLPGQTVESVVSTVKYLIKHRVKHISVYCLQVEKHTMLYDKLRRGQIKEVPEEKIVETYKKVFTILKKNGFVRYEVSNYSKPGFQCVHNQKYWNGTDYLGLGVSAHSYIDGYRYYNTKRLDTYIDNLRNGKSVVYSRQYISIAERRTEKIMLSLRTVTGLNLDEFKAEFNEDLLKSKSVQIHKLIENKMIRIENNYLIINDDYFYVSNSIILELL